MASAAEKFTFVVSWHYGELTHSSILEVFFDNDIQLSDMKSGKIIQPRIACPDLPKGKILIGDTISVLKRQLKVVGYGDEFTFGAQESPTDKTIGLMKTHSMSDVIQTLSVMKDFGFILTNMNTIQFDPNEIQGFLFDRRHETTHLKNGHTLLQGQLIAIEIFGTKAQEDWREMIDAQLYLAQNSNFKRVAIYGSISNLQYRKDVRVFFPVYEKVRRYTMIPKFNFKGCLLALIKPHAVREGIYTQIMQKILRMTFKISALKMHQLTLPEARYLFECLDICPEYPEMIMSFTESECIGLVISGFGRDTFSMFQRAVGSRHPDVAKLFRPQTIRAEFGTTTKNNAIYCTEIEEDAVTDCKKFFNF